MANKDVILRVKNITKNFPGVKALRGVDFALRKGEVHALIGENGAGKSTMMNIIIGSIQPTGGEMYFKGEKYQPKSPIDALSAGISMIHQEISLVNAITVSENIWLGREAHFGNRVFINKKAQELATKEILDKLGLNIDPGRELSRLSIAEMQLVEIARAVSYDSEVIIMDEPTSALTNAEISKLYAIIDDLRENGTSIIFISHKLEEVLHICDAITVFRDGQFVTELDAKKAKKEQLIAHMVGRTLENAYPKEAAEIGTTAFEVIGLNRKGVFQNINFQVRRGEILGFAGLMGAGRTEIMRAIFGADPKDEGELKMDGRTITIGNTTDAVKNRMSMVSEDRLHCGAFHDLSIQFNISSAYLRAITKCGFFDANKEKQDASEMVDRLSIKIASLDDDIGQLSGGNQQKAIIAKWLLTQPELLILDEPTRGIDVGAKAEIYKLIGNLAKQGKAIIVVSSELPELMGIADRILVVRGGEIVGEVARPQFNQELIMNYAFGIA